MHIHHKLTVLVVSIAAALSLAAVAVPGRAAARTFHVNGTGRNGVNVSTARCRWYPATGTFAPGNIKGTEFSFWWPSIYMLTGPDDGCPPAYPNPVDGDGVIVRCGYHNNFSGWWDYLYNYGLHKYGWVQDQNVTWKGSGANGTTCR
jgi:hypothetical protein